MLIYRTRSNLVRSKHISRFLPMKHYVDKQCFCAKPTFRLTSVAVWKLWAQSSKYRGIGVEQKFSLVFSLNLARRELTVSQRGIIKSNWFIKSSNFSFFSMKLLFVNKLKNEIKRKLLSHEWIKGSNRSWQTKDWINLRSWLWHFWGIVHKNLLIKAELKFVSSSTKFPRFLNIKKVIKVIKMWRSADEISTLNLIKHEATRVEKLKQESCELVPKKPLAKEKFCHSEQVF